MRKINKKPVILLSDTGSCCLVWILESPVSENDSKTRLFTQVFYLTTLEAIDMNLNHSKKHKIQAYYLLYIDI